MKQGTMICVTLSVILVCAQLSCIEAPAILSYFPVITTQTPSLDPPIRRYTFTVRLVHQDSSGGFFDGIESDSIGQRTLIGEWSQNAISFTVYRLTGPVTFRGVIISPGCYRLNLGTLRIGCPDMP